MQVLHRLPKFSDPRILIGSESMDDAGVYLIDRDTAIVQTVDILTPISDDPYIFGQIVAANALSDIYAMGGKPITALTILGYPPDQIDLVTIRRILKGIAHKIREADANIIGGHTIKDTEVKCGLAVTGLINPRKIITNNKARVGDGLILTKPLGTGVVSTALKLNKAPIKAVNKINRYMCQLNKAACEAMVELGIASATDITGFGFLGHALEMAEASNISMIIHGHTVPIFEEARGLAQKRLFPGGTLKNFEFVRPKVMFAPCLDVDLQMLLCDAQTSGGLLISVPKEICDKLLMYLVKKGVKSARLIGQVVKPRPKRIYIER